MKRSRCWLYAFMTMASLAAKAQDADSLIATPADTTFTSADSLSVFRLIDSLLNLPDDNRSQLAFRIGYNSNVLSAGRTLGIQNFGLSNGISYYHKAGPYADVTGYWSKDFQPSYYLTIASVGYMHDFSKKFSIMAEYDRYFYNTADGEDFIPYKNTLSVTPILEFKPVTVSMNYSYFFGDKQVHRLMPGINVLIQKKKWLGLDRIALYPSFYALFGNEVITDFILPANRKELREFFKLYHRGYKIESNNVFGVMNYAFSVPLLLSYKGLSFNFTYSYSIPVALPGEPLTISASSYLTGSLTYFIDLKRNKKTL